MDAVHAARDPGDQDTEGEEEASTEIGSLDGIFDQELSHRSVRRGGDTVDWRASCWIGS